MVSFYVLKRNARMGKRTARFAQDDAIRELKSLRAFSRPEDSLHWSFPNLVRCCRDEQAIDSDLIIEFEFDGARLCLSTLVGWCRPSVSVSTSPPISPLKHGYLVGLEFVSLHRPHQRLLRAYVTKMIERTRAQRASSNLQPACLQSQPCDLTHEPANWR
ncbi:MAG: hypothetical protein ACI8W7_001628 [Gammaproteobacteria bacterium]